MHMVLCTWNWESGWRWPKYSIEEEKPFYLLLLGSSDLKELQCVHVQCVRILLIYDISIQHTSCTSCMHVSVCDITEIILWSSNIPMIVILLVILTCITRRKPNLYSGMPLSLTKWSAVCKAHSYPHSTYKGGVSDKWPTQCQWPSPTLTAHTEPIHGYRQKWHHKLKVSWHIVYRALSVKKRLEYSSKKLMYLCYQQCL